MSGSGGSGGGSYEPQPDCKDIVEKTVLNSPNAAVLAQLKPQDQLTLEVKPKGGKTVVAVWKKQTAGSITFAQIAALKNCIEAGHKFIAVVLQIKSGRCEVLVKPAGTQ